MSKNETTQVFRLITWAEGEAIRREVAAWDRDDITGRLLDAPCRDHRRSIPDERSREAAVSEFLANRLGATFCTSRVGLPVPEPARGLKKLKPTDSVEELALSVRAANLLHKAGIFTIGQLTTLTRAQVAELSKPQDAGAELQRSTERAVACIEAELGKVGLKLADGANVVEAIERAVACIESEGVSAAEWAELERLIYSREPPSVPGWLRDAVKASASEVKAALEERLRLERGGHRKLIEFTNYGAKGEPPAWIHEEGSRRRSYFEGVQSDQWVSCITSESVRITGSDMGWETVEIRPDGWEEAFVEVTAGRGELYLGKWPLDRAEAAWVSAVLFQARELWFEAAKQEMLNRANKERS